MTVSRQASQKIDSFRSSLAEFKESHGYTYEDLEEICEVSAGNLGKFMHSKCSPHATSLIKISLATGIAI